MSIPLLAIVGATASGKSSLALRLAEKLDGEIISCDSMQIYRRMDIGTAKPTKEEQEAIKHHMIDLIPPDTPYSCAEYASDARRAVSEAASRGKLPIVVGGTGLYLDSLLFERPYALSSAACELREKLLTEAGSEGGAHRLWLELFEVDPESAEKIHENNTRRVVRALEIYRSTGIKKSELDKIGGTPIYRHLVICLRYPDRAALLQRIEKRVDDMLASGLLSETEELYRSGVFAANSTAAQAIGYKEMLGYIRGETSLAECRESLIIATRQYAKRQMTWFSAKDYVNMIDVTSNEPDPTERALALWQDFLLRA